MSDLPAALPVNDSDEGKSTDLSDVGTSSPTPRRGMNRPKARIGFERLQLQRAMSFGSELLNEAQRGKSASPTHVASDSEESESVEDMQAKLDQLVKEWLS